MELKEMYSPEGEMNLVEPESQAEQERLALGWTDKKPKAKAKPKTEAKAE